MNYILTTKTESELYHHGVKGMKWGTRKLVESSDVKTSKHRLKLEEKYKKEGYSSNQAVIKANDRIKTEKIIATSAAITVAACSAYLINKRLKSRVDGVIKNGDILQRIEMKDTGGGLHDTFYVSKGRHDNKRYAAVLGKTRYQQTGKAYLMKLQADGNIKIASQENASKIFGDLYKNDPEFRKSVFRYVSIHPNMKDNIVKDKNDVSKRNIRKMYENFNSYLPSISKTSSGADKKFYSELKKSGYGAIQDINDMKYNKYATRNPLLVFDNSKGYIKTKSIREMTPKEIDKIYDKEVAKAKVERIIQNKIDGALNSFKKKKR